MSAFDENRAVGGMEKEGRTASVGWFVVSLVVGYAVYRVVAIIEPDMRGRWQVLAVLKGLVGIAILSAWIAYFVARAKIARSRAKAMAVFCGLLLPWVFRFVLAAAEFIQGAGI